MCDSKALTLHFTSSPRVKLCYKVREFFISLSLRGKGEMAGPIKKSRQVKI